MKKICVCSGKGGVGKSSIALNLGMLLAHEGNKVLFLDLDSQCNTTNRFKQSPNDSLNKLFGGKGIVTDYIVETNFKNTSLLPGSLQTDDLNKKMRTALDNGQLSHPEKILAMKLANLEGFDYVIIDTAPSLDFMTQNGIVASTATIIPTDDSKDGLKGAIEVVGAVRQLKVPILGVVLNRVNPRTSLYNRLNKELNNLMQGLPFEHSIRQSVLVSETSFTKDVQPVFLRDPNNPLVLDYVNFKHEVVERLDKLEVK